MAILSTPGTLSYMSEMYIFIKWFLHNDPSKLTFFFKIKGTKSFSYIRQMIACRKIKMVEIDSKLSAIQWKRLKTPTFHHTSAQFGFKVEKIAQVAHSWHFLRDCSLKPQLLTYTHDSGVNRQITKGTTTTDPKTTQTWHAHGRRARRAQADKNWRMTWKLMHKHEEFIGLQNGKKIFEIR